MSAEISRRRAATRATMAIVVMASPLLSSAPTLAHRRWGDGSAVSERIKQLCCGDAEAHLLPPGSVRALSDGWHIDGYDKPVPYGRELPSPDGEEWGFWANYVSMGVHWQSELRCLFLNPRML